MNRKLLSWKAAHTRAFRMLIEAAAIGVAVGYTARLLREVIAHL